MGCLTQSVLFPTGICKYLACPRGDLKEYFHYVMDAEMPMSRTPSLPADQPLAPALVATQSKSRAWIQQVFQAVVAAGLAIANYYLISHYLVQSVQVVGSSMVPTLHNSEHYLLNRWVYHFRTPQHSDIIVIRDPAVGCFSVKRIIGLPGDAIYLSKGFVYVNGKKLPEPYLDP